MSHRGFVFALSVVLVGSATLALQVPDRGPKPDLDVRLSFDRPRAPMRTPTLAQRTAAEAAGRIFTSRSASTVWRSTRAA